MQSRIYDIFASYSIYLRPRYEQINFTKTNLKKKERKMKKTLFIMLGLVLAGSLFGLTYTQTVNITNSTADQTVTFDYYDYGNTLINVEVILYTTVSGGSISADNDSDTETSEVTLTLGASFNLDDGGVAPRLLNASFSDIWDSDTEDIFTHSLSINSGDEGGSGHPIFDPSTPDGISYSGTNPTDTNADDISSSFIAGYDGSGTFSWTLEKTGINNVSSVGGSVDGQFTSLDLGGYVRIIYTDDQPLPVELSTFTATFTNQELILRWITQSETNNSHWNVYRSEFEDYSQAYQINGTPVEGQGTISEPTTYVYHDINSSLPETTYWYWLENVDYSGESSLHGPASVTTPQLDNPEPPQVPDVYGLKANYPNPFNPSTIIQFRLKETEPVDLTIYDIKGRKIKTLHQGVVNADVMTSIVWDGTDDNAKSVSSGLYFYKLVTPTRTEAKKMLLAK
jgi:hypothetical protein